MDLEGHDPEQIRLMDEVCIVLDHNDTPIGSASKKTCHLMTNISKGLLHRAFSVFLFDPHTHRLLLQQRSAEKITFPGMWTNTCCSHPLGVPGETGSELTEAVAGVKRAAVRKLGHELGIKADEVPVEEFEFLTRIHYLAGSGTDGVWGEHESMFFWIYHFSLAVCADVNHPVDYILIITPSKPITVEPSANEVSDTCWVTQEELNTMFKDSSLTFTPWFQLICDTMLFEWWNHLKDGGLEKYKGEKVIRRMV